MNTYIGPNVSLLVAGTRSFTLIIDGIRRTFTEEEGKRLVDALDKEFGIRSEGYEKALSELEELV